MDFNEQKIGDDYSQDDLKFMKILKEGIHQLDDGHYEMPLPFRELDPNLPNNKSLVLHRLKKLKIRFQKDQRYRDDYVKFMQDNIQSGYAEKVLPIPSGRSNVWYIPHHGVYHPKKPGKIRVVFDCSSKYMGDSLNDHLLPGPDLTNTLILWWDDGNIELEPSEYRMNVHLFGAGSSPGCANFGLKQTANDNEQEFGSVTADFVRHNFYVDDGLKSVATPTEAVNLINNSKALCAKGGLRLHKFISNSKVVIDALKPEDRAKEITDVDILQDKLQPTRALGIQWCIESDTFQFRISIKDQPLTRRGILSTVSSIYDPLGFIAPLVLTGKQILQQMCKDQLNWDDPLPDSLKPSWDRWKSSLSQLQELKILRCYKPDGFGNIKSIELHNFSDASDHGYGQCSYLRLVDENKRVHCSLVGKCRVAPLKSITVPRLELTAALVSVKVSAFLRKELHYDNITEFFWTDSRVVLGYITNDSRKFKVFVANRVQQIKDYTKPDQWRYVEGKVNPADVASRGLSAEVVQISSGNTKFL